MVISFPSRFTRHFPLTAFVSLTALVACSSSSSTGAASDAGTGTSASDAAAPGSDSAASSVDASTHGLTVSNATVASLDGTYDLVPYRTTAGGGLAFNGNFNGQIELEVDTDMNGAVLAAHFWNYTTGDAGPMPDKFYGCDGGKTAACTGVTVDAVKNTITFASVVWHEVQNPPSFDGSTADTPVAGGAQLTLAGTLQALVQ